MESLENRYEEAMKQIADLTGDAHVSGNLTNEMPEPFRRYFFDMGSYLLRLDAVRKGLKEQGFDGMSLEKLQEDNLAMYRDILPGNYDVCQANPAYACSCLGEETGRLLAFFAAELYELPGWMFETVPDPDRIHDGAQEALETVILHLETFLRIFRLIAGENQSKTSAFSGKTGETLQDDRMALLLRELLREEAVTACGIIAADRVHASITPGRGVAASVVSGYNLEDLRYLYRFGEYVTQSELDTARYLNRLSDSRIDSIARTFTEGFRTGFVKAGKNLAAKKTAEIEFHLGFERLVRRSGQLLSEMGLKTVIYRRALSRITKSGTIRRGYCGAAANPQFDYDHREDQALFLDEGFIRRKLDVLENAYRECGNLAAEYAGPAVIETFGEEPFSPADSPWAVRLDREQQDLSVRLRRETVQMVNQYIIPEERSFTIIAFPVPAIGDRFEEIFRETMRVNTLNNALYEQIQQKLIDTLDTAQWVHVAGRNGNRTDLHVNLMKLTDPEKESVFENCTADVNIPVGEVFTSPCLEGTDGVLHVKQVYLNGLNYHDLSLTFRDGMITDYSCGDFDDPEESRSYIRNTVLFQHDTLPMGEFAIGTNTTAYAMMQRFNIGARIPILIAEKCGPHFAVGDTCYSWEEDIPVFNPDGKEVIARDNSVSRKRKTDPSKAYFGCHTDITIPYSQLGILEAVKEDGTRIPVLKDGRFVLPGTEVLNEALDNIYLTT